MNKSRIIIGLGLLVLLVAGLMIAFSGGQEELGEDRGVVATENTFVKNEFDFSFEKPEGYEVVETIDQSILRYSYVLSPEDSVTPEVGEGPPAITVDVFEDPDEDDLGEWLRGNNVSNYNLKLGEASEVRVDGERALRYEWDGLYRGRSVVLKHEGNIILISGTYLDASDPIYSDFEDVVDSFRLD